MAATERAVEILREQLANAEGEVDRLQRAIDVLTGRRRGPGRPPGRRGPGRPRLHRGPGRPPKNGRRKRRKFSAATIAKMRAAQRARWAKIKGRKGRAEAKAEAAS